MLTPEEEADEARADLARECPELLDGYLSPSDLLEMEKEERERHP